MEILIAIFLAVFVFCIVFLVLYSIFNSKTRIKNRLNILLEKENKDKNQQKQKDKKTKRETRFGFGKQLAADLETAGILLRPEEYLLVWAAATIVPSLIFFLLGGNVLSVAAVLIIGFVIPPLVVARFKRKRMQKFEKQLGDSIVLISNGLRAGFTFHQAMEGVAKEMPNPIATEFSRTLLEIKLGSSVKDAMERMASRTKSDDLSLLVSAILIQRKAGGNLADVLDNISNTIRDRLRIKGQIKVYTASGRISGIIIGLLPVILFAIIMIINPDYIMQFFATPLGIVMIIVAVFMEIIGFMIIRKIVNIKL